MTTSVHDAGVAGAALSTFSEGVRAAYGDRLRGVVLFGSRARGSGSAASDVDVAIILDAIGDRSTERLHLADLAYDVIAATGIEIQAWPLSIDEWESPGLHRNPSLVQAMQRDGQLLRTP